MRYEDMTLLLLFTILAAGRSWDWWDTGEYCFRWRWELVMEFCGFAVLRFLVDHSYEEGFAVCGCGFGWLNFD
ncbi:hypothetical protein BZA05DRAFT_39109 [Tricharina praecox]|uniref:uncharacterized protein n=1 Tax=Tricharina praecox TaxID=43433 RepID=UPI002220C1FB|nr:uncharacterized protein BZA05DRAFT_39109 [Tricharina praecox]KAI5852221.1 hypothetical protein BZA05DRAFT_39109 [Tricharina praecox]